jgi:hypothetical protein
MAGCLLVFSARARGVGALAWLAIGLFCLASATWTPYRRLHDRTRRCGRGSANSVCITRIASA